MPCQILVSIYHTKRMNPLYNRALEKVIKEQLIWKRFEKYQTISCFRAFIPTFSLNSIMEPCFNVNKICYSHRNNYWKYFYQVFWSTLKEIHTISSLTYFSSAIFSMPNCIQNKRGNFVRWTRKLYLGNFSNFLPSTDIFL